jgi:hypothetical protein
MFHSPERLAGEIRSLLDAIRGVAGSRYACLLEPGRLVFESPEAPGEAWPLRRLIDQRKASLFALPEGLAAGGPLEDAFEGWEDDEFFLAFINRRVALVVACPEAEAARDRLEALVRALADRLFRYDERYRLDPQGRGFFFGRAKLDIIVVGRST